MLCCTLPDCIPSTQSNPPIHQGDETESKVHFSTAPPKPIVPSDLSNVELNDIDPLEIARQLTLIEYSLYKAIKPWECLGQVAAPPLPTMRTRRSSSLGWGVFVMARSPQPNHSHESRLGPRRPPETRRRQTSWPSSSASTRCRVGPPRRSSRWRASRSGLPPWNASFRWASPSSARRRLLCVAPFV